MTDSLVTPTIPKELEDLVGSVKALATAHNLLDKGSYPHVKLQAVKMCLEYLRVLYEEAITDALAHPAWELSEELKLIHAERVRLEAEKREQANIDAGTAASEALDVQA